MGGEADVITVACVWTGQKYGIEYVERLRDGVRRHLRMPHTFRCLTDHEYADVPGVVMIPVTRIGLDGWWAKLALLAPVMRGIDPTIYLDLDTVIVGDLTPLARVAADPSVTFGICANFTRAVNPEWLCRYGSCVMTFAPGWGLSVWEQFTAHRERWIGEAGRYGDQFILERLVPAPDVTILQHALPDNYLIGYRDLVKLPAGPPNGTAVINFGGSKKPHNTDCRWARNAWLAPQRSIATRDLSRA